MLLSIFEIVDILITTIAGGYIFMDSLRMPPGERRTFGERLLFSIAVAAPAIVLHEFGHKLVGVLLGFHATFHAAYVWLGIGIVLKMLGSPFLFLVPAYVTIEGAGGLAHALIAFAGPAINGLLWGGAWLALRYGKWSRTTEAILYYTKSVNMFLFIFNMIPLPFFDGYQVFTNLF